MKTMKHGLLTILTFLGLSTFGQITWTGPTTVDPSNISGDNVRPRIVMTDGGVPCVIWHSAGTIWASRFENGAFITPTQVNPPNTDPHITNWTSTEISAAGNVVFIVWQNTPMATEHVYIQQSTDGGLTWDDTVRVDNIPGTEISAFPNVSVAPSGNPAVSYMLHDANWANPHYVVANSTDNGQTFNAEVDCSQAIGGAEVCDCCPSWILNEGSRQTVIWRNNDINLRDMWMSVSADGGQTFTGSDVDPNSWNISICPSTGADGIVNGDSLYYAWVSGASGEWLINLSSVNLNDQQIGQYGTLGEDITGSTTQNYPKIAGTGDYMLLVFENVFSNDYDAYYIFSNTGLSGLEGLRGDPLHTTTTGTQRNPDVAFHGGQFYVVYQDEFTNTVEMMIGTIDNYTGVEELVDENINVYPNPAVDQVTIDGVEGYERLELTDVSGRTLRSMSLRSSKVELSVEDLPAGNYVVRLVNSEGNSVKRTIIVR